MVCTYCIRVPALSHNIYFIMWYQYTVCNDHFYTEKKKHEKKISLFTPVFTKDQFKKPPWQHFVITRRVYRKWYENDGYKQKIQAISSVRSWSQSHFCQKLFSSVMWMCTEKLPLEFSWGLHVLLCFSLFFDLFDPQIQRCEDTFQRSFLRLRMSTVNLVVGSIHVCLIKRIRVLTKHIHSINVS